MGSALSRLLGGEPPGNKDTGVPASKANASSPGMPPVHFSLRRPVMKIERGVVYVSATHTRCAGNGLAAMSLRRYVFTPLCLYAAMSLRRYVATLLCRYAAMSLRRYVSFRLCRYVAVPRGVHTRV